MFDTEAFVKAEINIPLPNERFEDGMIIASCWQNDDPAPGLPLTATILILRPVPEFYTVAEMEHVGGRWHMTDASDFPNIIPAAEEYSDRIGGY